MSLPTSFREGGQNGYEKVEAHEEENGLRRFYFIPEVGPDTVRDEGEVEIRERQLLRPIEIVVVGDPTKDPQENKAQLGKYIAQKTVEAMKEIVARGKLVLWNMATGATFNWPEFLPKLLKESGIDPSKIIPMIKEEVWDKQGKHFPPGHPFDFRGRRIKGFHESLGITPQNVQVSPDGNIKGNILAPDYDMSPEEGAGYMNEAWQALIKTGQCEVLTTTGVGTDLHVGEMQINKQGFRPSMTQRDFFLQNEEDYSRERGMFRWSDEKGGFRPEDNIFVHLDEESKWQQAGRALRMGTPPFGKIMGIGYRAMLESSGGAIFAFDSREKALAARMALEGSFDGAIEDVHGNKIAEIERDKGEGFAILSDLERFCKDLQASGILDERFFAKYEQLKTEQGQFIVDAMLTDIYRAYEEKRIISTNENYQHKYYEPLWTLVNRALGKRSPLSRQIRGLAVRGTKITLVMTPEAAGELSFLR